MSTSISSHCPDPETPFDETIRALDDIVQQGKACYIGVSNFRLAQIETCMRLRRIDVVQYGWNMFDPRMQAEIFPYCVAQEIGVMAYGSLAYGMLSGTFQPGMQFEESDWRSRGGMLGNLNLFRTLFGPEHFLRTLDAVEDLKRLVAKYAIRIALDPRQPGRQHGAGRLSRAWRGDRKPRGLGWTISATDMAEIDAILARHGCVTVPRAGSRIREGVVFGVVPLTAQGGASPMKSAT